MRLAEWPRDPYLNEEVREWVQLHLETLGVTDVAVYAAVVGRDEDERRVVVATEVGLVDSWYAPQGSSARFGLSVRLYPWQAVHGVDLRGETTRVWAYEHESRWRLRIARPALDLLAETPELGRALAQFAAACAVMAEPAGSDETSAAPEVGFARDTSPPADVRHVPAPPPRADMPMPEPPREVRPARQEDEQSPAPRAAVAPAPAAPPEAEPRPPSLPPAPQVVAAEPSEPVERAERDVPAVPAERHAPAAPVEQHQAIEPAAPVEQPQATGIAGEVEREAESVGGEREMMREEPAEAPAMADVTELNEQPSTEVSPQPEPVQAESAPPGLPSPRAEQAQLQPGREAEPAQPIAAEAESGRDERVSPQPPAPPPAPRPVTPPAPAVSTPEPVVNYEEQYPGEEVLFGINPLPTEAPPAPRRQDPSGSILRPERNGDATASVNGTPAAVPTPNAEGRQGPFPRQPTRPAAHDSGDGDGGTGQGEGQRRMPFPGQIFRIGGGQASGAAPHANEASERTPIKVEAESTAEVIQDLERRLGLRPRR